MAGEPTADARTRLEDMPTCELLSWLLSLAEAEPRRAPDDVVALVRGALERLEDDGRPPCERSPDAPTRRQP